MLRLGPTVALAVIPNVEPQLPRECSITGWGKSDLHHKYKDTRYAHEGDVKVLRPEVCEKKFSFFNINNHLCFGCDRGDNPCTCLGEGDSGGPVVCRVDGVDTVVTIQIHGQATGKDCAWDRPSVGVKINEDINEWIDGVKLQKLQQECRPYHLIVVLSALAVYLQVYYYM